MKELRIACSGYDIAADWYEGESTDRILLVLPGFRSSKAVRETQDYVNAMVEATRMSALVIDLSGHGQSPFRLRETRPAQHLLEIVHAFDWLKSEYPDAEISVSGHSYGGFLGAQLTEYRTFEKLILRAPAIYKPAALYDPWSIRIADPETYEAAMRDYRHDREALATHPLLTQAAQFKGKVLVVAHGQDAIVPAEVTDAYTAAFAADSLGFPDLAHSFEGTRPETTELKSYHERIAAWLQV